jgi:1-acyl-sn-glycerol-3-phosphate acyltransferase
MSAKHIILAVYSVLLWAFFVFSSTLLIILACIIWTASILFDRRLHILQLFSCFWGSLYIWVNPLWRVRKKGRKNIKRRTAYIVVSNHQSMLDIPLLYNLFFHFKFLSKSENFRVPFVGWLMRLNRYPEIERGSKISKLKLFDRIKELISQGSSVMIFPEGTRYPGGYLGPFREGAFRMALDNRAPILPIVLDGTARALPKKGFVIPGRSDIRLQVLEEIPYEAFSGMQVREISALVREKMETTYKELQNELGTAVAPDEQES